ncbi:hypothetical protein [Paraburkholderia hayleyella]|uniref:hypothetical protein n=1 Tax=Paraburkholderia hayleyella TaxID=2152889 RepID=UPI001292A637|nr:hypothetical protein [Paraburkholderia hayleyella]
MKFNDIKRLSSSSNNKADNDNQDEYFTGLLDRKITQAPVSSTSSKSRENPQPPKDTSPPVYSGCSAGGDGVPRHEYTKQVNALRQQLDEETLTEADLEKALDQFGHDWMRNVQALLPQILKNPYFSRVVMKKWIKSCQKNNAAPDSALKPAISRPLNRTAPPPVAKALARPAPHAAPQATVRKAQSTVPAAGRELKPVAGYSRGSLPEDHIKVWGHCERGGESSAISLILKTADNHDALPPELVFDFLSTFSTEQLVAIFLNEKNPVAGYLLRQIIYLNNDKLQYAIYRALSEKNIFIDKSWLDAAYRMANRPVVNLKGIHAGLLESSRNFEKILLSIVAKDNLNGILHDITKLLDLKYLDLSYPDLDEVRLTLMMARLAKQSMTSDENALKKWQIIMKRLAHLEARVRKSAFYQEDIIPNNFEYILGNLWPCPTDYKDNPEMPEMQEQYDDSMENDSDSTSSSCGYPSGYDSDSDFSEYSQGNTDDSSDEQSENSQADNEKPVIIHDKKNDISFPISPIKRNSNDELTSSTSGSEESPQEISYLKNHDLNETIDFMQLNPEQEDQVSGLLNRGAENSYSHPEIEEEENIVPQQSENSLIVNEEPETNQNKILDDDFLNLITKNIDSMKKELQDKNKTINKQSIEINELYAENDKLHEKLEQQNNLLEKTEEEYNELRGNSTRLFQLHENDTARYENDISSKSKEISELKKSLAAITKDFHQDQDTALHTIEEKNMEIERLSKKSAENERTITQLKDVNDRLTEEKSKIAEENKKLVQEHHDMELRIASKWQQG